MFVYPRIAQEYGLDNNVSTVFTFKHFRSENFLSMAGVSDNTIFTLRYFQVKPNFSHSCLPSTVSYY